MKVPLNSRLVSCVICTNAFNRMRPFLLRCYMVFVSIFDAWSRNCDFLELDKHTVVLIFMCTNGLCPQKRSLNWWLDWTFKATCCVSIYVFPKFVCNADLKTKICLTYRLNV